MEVGTVVSLVFGAWGAGLSTLLARRQIRGDRRSLAVSCQVSFAPDEFGELEPVAFVSAVNEGHRPVEASSIVFWLSNSEPVWAMPYASIDQPGMPQLLGDGQSMVAAYDWHALSAIAREQDAKVVRVTVFDGGRNKYEAPVRILPGLDEFIEGQKAGRSGPSTKPPR